MIIFSLHVNIDNLEEKLWNCCETEMCRHILDSEVVKIERSKLLCQGDRSQNERILYGSEGSLTEFL